jgi:hypothetical protein
MQQLEQPWVEEKSKTPPASLTHSHLQKECKRFFKSILSTCRKESPVLIQVFPNRNEVVKQILTQLFIDIIPRFIEDALQCVKAPLLAALRTRVGAEGKANAARIDPENPPAPPACDATCARLMEVYLKCLELLHTQTEELLTALINFAVDIASDKHTSYKSGDNPHTSSSSSLSPADQSSSSIAPTPENSAAVSSLHLINAQETMDALFSDHLQEYVRWELERTKLIVKVEIARCFALEEERSKIINRKVRVCVRE